MNAALYSKMKIVKISVFFMVVSLSAGCKEPINMTTEQSVYEALFAERIGDTYTKYYVANATENDWFKEHPFNKYPWAKSLDDLGGISVDLIKELYRVNQASYPLDWKPIVTNAEFLPGSFAHKPKKSEVEDRCFAENTKGNVGVYKTGKGQFRSFYTVSKVAFSKDGKVALLKVSYLCAPLSGASEFFVTFKLENGQWHPLGGLLLWIS